MSTLIVTLPAALDSVAAEYDYVLIEGGTRPHAHGRCAAALLPALDHADDELLALVPAQALSWHALRLPAAIGKTLRKNLSMLSGSAERGRSAEQRRLRAVLVGLLEEQLLAEADQLLFAAFPGASTEDPTWVAVCPQAWLLPALQALQAGGHHVSRVLPELAPADAAAQPAQVHLRLEASGPRLLLSSQQAVLSLPLNPASVVLLRQYAPLRISAEPALATLAEQTFATDLTLRSAAELALLAANSPWNLAQFDARAGRLGRVLKGLPEGWRKLRTGPQWRPTRWGLLALLLTQIVGLNAWAWKEQALLTEQRSQLRSLLTSTFPEVQVVVDAPAQMQRQWAALQLSSGQFSGPGLDSILLTLTRVTPGYQPLTALEANADEFSLQGPPLAGSQADSLIKALAAQGLHATLQDGHLKISRGGLP